MQTPNLDLFRKRDLGELIQDSFRFVLQNARQLLTAILLYVGPLYLGQAIISAFFLKSTGLMNVDFEELMQDPANALQNILLNNESVLQNPGLMALSWLLGIATFVMMAAVVNGAVRAYGEDGELTLDRLRSFAFGHLLPFTGLSLLNLLIFIGAYIAMAIVMALLIAGGAALGGAFSVLLAITGVLLILVGIVYLMSILGIAYPARMSEGISSTAAISRAFHITKGSRWFTVGLFVVLLLINLMLSLGVLAVAGILGLVMGSVAKIGALLVFSTLVSSVISAFINSILWTGLNLQYINLSGGPEQQNRMDDYLGQIQGDFKDDQTAS